MSIDTRPPLQAGPPGYVRLTSTLSIPLASVNDAEPGWQHTLTAQLAARMWEHEGPGKAVAELLAVALDAACLHDDELALLSLGAAIHLLKGVAEVQAQGVTS